MKAWETAKNALECVLDAVPGESVLIVCDDEKREVGKAFAEGALALGLWSRLITLETSKEIRKEIPLHLLEALTKEKPEIYVNLMCETREETPFRIKVIHLQTRDKRSRLGHCPGVTLDMLINGALALTREEHRKMQNFADKLMQKLNDAIQIEITNPAGTKISLNVKGREFITDTKFNWKLMKWLNLPTGEVYVAPLENSLKGKLVCDMAIGGIGPIKTPLEILARNGRAEEVSSNDNVVLEKVKNTLQTDAWSNIVGEFAFGINPKARLVKEFLEDEKILGTIHIAFGHNLDMPGGKNASKNHIDLLVSKPTVKVAKADGQVLTILREGVFDI